MLGALLFQGCGILTESREDRLVREQREAQIISESIESGDFKMDIRQMIPMAMAPRHVTNYSVTVEGDHINSHLPYAGRAWDLPYGGGHALNFESDIQEKAVFLDESDGSYTVRLLVRTDEDTHIYTFHFSLGGSATLLVQSKNREPINFTGTFLFDEE